MKEKNIDLITNIEQAPNDRLIVELNNDPKQHYLLDRTAMRPIGENRFMLITRRTAKGGLAQLALCPTFAGDIEIAYHKPWN